MKILIFSDIHFHHSHRFSQVSQEGFTTRELEHLSCADTIEKLYDKYKFDSIVFAGDMFGPVGDNVSCQTLVAVSTFLRKISRLCPVKIIVGNHDLSGTVNNKQAHKLEVFKDWKNVDVYDLPIVEENFVYVPYNTCEEYLTSFLEAIPEKKDKIIFSHVEMKGINLGNGIFTEKGIAISLLDKFKQVFQGHYHNAGKYGKHINIVGSTQRLSFKDQGVARKNIIIYNTEDNTIIRESFECPDWKTFDDTNIEDILKTDINNYVKVDVTFDKLLTPEIRSKLDLFKGKDIHINVNRISLNRDLVKQRNEDMSNKTESTVLFEFIEDSDNSVELKTKLKEEAMFLLNSVKK